MSTVFFDFFSFASSGVLNFPKTKSVIFFGKGILSRVWTLFNICVGLWGIGAFFIGIIKDPTTALIVWRIVHVAIAFIPILMFHVVYLLCNLRSKKFLCFAYIQGIIFSIL